jgi:hypothetical protein
VGRIDTLKTPIDPQILGFGNRWYETHIPLVRSPKK